MFMLHALYFDEATIIYLGNSIIVCYLKKVNFANEIINLYYPSVNKRSFFRK